MGVRVVPVDLPEDSRRVLDRANFAASKTALPTPYLRCKGKLRSRKHTNCRARIFWCSEPSGAGIEVVGSQFIANLGRTRLHIVQAVIAHAEDLLCCPQPQPTKQEIRLEAYAPHGCAIRP